MDTIFRFRNKTMSDVEYQVISYMKKSDKGEVCLAAVDWMDFPVVVKRITCGNAAVYRAVQKMESEFFRKYILSGTTRMELY